jgi:putative chitinase
MMILTVATLVAAGIGPTQARIFVDPLKAACALFDISTPPRVAGFVAQCRVESTDFTRLEEGLFYTTPERIRAVFSSRVPSLQVASTLTRRPRELANRVYAGRNGNGDEASGDGWAYRGRGLIQLTGRANYADAAVELNRPYVENPGLIAEPPDACLTAAWYWHSKNLSLLADSAQWDSITRAVNGRAMLHAAQRRQYAEEGVTVFA